MKGQAGTVNALSGVDFAPIVESVFHLVLQGLAALMFNVFNVAAHDVVQQHRQRNEGVVGLTLGADVGGGGLVVQGVLSVRGHVVHTNGGHRNHGDAAQRQHLNVFAHVLGLT